MNMKDYLLLGSDDQKESTTKFLARTGEAAFGSEARGYIEAQAHGGLPISELAGRVSDEAPDAAAFAEGWNEALIVRVKKEHQAARVPRYTRTRKEVA